MAGTPSSDNPATSDQYRQIRKMYNSMYVSHVIDMSFIGLCSQLWLFVMNGVATKTFNVIGHPEGQEATGAERAEKLDDEKKKKEDEKAKRKKEEEEAKRKQEEEKQNFREEADKLRKKQAEQN